jgi:mono/diheme cytochrome c family protein
MFGRRHLLGLGACLVLITGSHVARAADVGVGVGVVGLSEGRSFSEKDGESLYHAVCQACHMAEGQGASGAGAYPALAADPRLASSNYPVLNVLYGRKGMPAFADMLDDEQVSAVTNYVRTHMGNHYTDAVSAADVATSRRARKAP